MSLFRAKEWWSWRVTTNDGTPDEVDGTAGAVAVANIDNDPAGKMKVVVGSLSGILRIFLPKGGPSGGSTVEDLIVERNLQWPILQLLPGRFISGSSELFLAVLHPYSLAVYAVSAVKSGGVAAYYDIQQVAAHKFARPAYNMTSGAFGGDRTSAGSEAICVQSLDGVLQFYLNGSFAFHRLLPQSSFIIPGPLLYLSASDRLITANSEMVLECYRYSALASAGDNVDVDPTLMTGKRLTADWKAKLGDHITWLGAARFTQGANEDVVALGDQTLFVVDDKGRVKSQRRLEYPCTCAFVCPLLQVTGEGDGVHQLLIGTQTGHILVLRERALVWCCLVGPSPITAITVAEFGDTMGMICSLDDAGLLRVSYLATDPPVASTMINTDSRDCDYDQMEAEHRQLLDAIRRHHQEKEEAGQPAEEQLPPREVHVKVHVPSTIDPPTSVDELAFQPEQDDLQGLFMQHDGLPQQITVEFEITNTDVRGRAARGLTLSVQPLSDAITTLMPKIMSLPDVQPGGPPTRASLTFYISTHILCSCRDVELVLTYTLGDTLRCSTSSFELPLCFMANPIPPTNEANFKVAIGATAIPPTLGSIFQDFLQGASAAGSHTAPEGSVRNILSLRLACGKDVTILQSKTSGRFCVQSTEFGPLWVGLAELERRCKDYFVEGDFQLTYLDSLPLQDYFALVDDHFSIRHHLQGLRLEVGKKSLQYRDNQKQLLTRLRDKQPTDLNGMDELLEVTYGGLIEVLDEIEDARAALRVLSGDLAAATELMIGLMKWRFDMGEEDTQHLRQVLSSTALRPASDSSTTDFDLSNETEDTHLMSPTQGWHERTECAVGQLLKMATFTKSGRDEAFTTGQCRIPEDTSGHQPRNGSGGCKSGRLKKLITRLIDRLAHGARPTRRE
ncbi:hypothetical protein FOZ61_001993 [Perkinsus olseni]|uniref:Bardet-Biedl syndrome 9 protein n=1 Tax=Perkinsus olseni TaxID=32597 RepID=A0A7J6LUT1_PEROL|nr:hypothetical protein FOZ61_001993 [Perkinsus olseni]